ncbi:MAG: hypothetical protein RIA69_13850 [Cyclobacteriaceae bacterium]
MSKQFLVIESEITSRYLYDENLERPWMIDFSGGKDSILLLQLVWNILRKIPYELRNRKIHIVCNNTLVDNPRILSFIDKTLQHYKEELFKLQEIKVLMKRKRWRQNDMNTRN